MPLGTKDERTSLTVYKMGLAHRVWLAWLLDLRLRRERKLTGEGGLQRRTYMRVSGSFGKGLLELSL